MCVVFAEIKKGIVKEDLKEFRVFDNLKSVLSRKKRMKQQREVIKKMMQLKMKVMLVTCFTIAAVCLWLEGF